MIHYLFYSLYLLTSASYGDSDSLLHRCHASCSYLSTELYRPLNRTCRSLCHLDAEPLYCLNDCLNLGRLNLETHVASELEHCENSCIKYLHSLEEQRKEKLTPEIQPPTTPDNGSAEVAVVCENC